MENEAMKDFCNLCGLTSLNSNLACYKNPPNSSCINLILTNRTKSFQNITVIDTGLSDFHKMAITITKTNFRKAEPRIVHYRNF